MPDLVILCSFPFVSEAYVAQGILADNGIKTYITDELMSQMGINYAAPIGGIKLRVNSEELETAVEVCKKVGYLTYYSQNTDYGYLSFIPAYLLKFNRYSKRIPYLKDIGLVARLMITVLLLSIIIAIIINLL